MNGVAHNNETRLVFIMGTACVGKSTLGKRLAQELRFMLLDSDNFSSHYTKELSKLHGFDENDRDSPRYLKTIKPIEANVSYSLVAANLHVGVSVIIPTVIQGLAKQEDWVRDYLATNNLGNVKVKVIQLYNSNEEGLKNAIIKRGNQQDGWKLTHWDDYYQSIQDYEVTWNGVDKLIYDNSRWTSLEDIDRFVGSITK